MNRQTPGLLIENLRNEYLDLNEKIAKASFALSTMDFDKTESELLEKQIQLEVSLLMTIEERAQHAAGKRKTGEK